METIVVGVDGSACADAALDFAIEEAAFRGAVLRVLSPWELPAIFDASGAFSSETLDSLQEKARTTLANALARVAKLSPSVQCAGFLVEGHMAEVILKETQGAALVVVGHSRRSGFTGHFWSSVSERVLRHADCPVAVVHESHAGGPHEN
jgi:nucleotide-binding universal stress UspA family protein